MKPIKFDTFWRNEENQKYLNKYKEPLFDAPEKVKQSFWHYKQQMIREREKIKSRISLD